MPSVPVLLTPTALRSKGFAEAAKTSRDECIVNRVAAEADLLLALH